MGTIVTRKRGNGSTAYMAKIRVKRDGEIIHRETETFDRRPAAAAWIAKREEELAKPGGIERAKIAENDPLLTDVIDKYIEESEKEIGKTKAQVLRTIKTYPIAKLRCSEIGSETISSFATSLKDVQASTRGNYVSHLAAIFAVARPVWKYPLDPQAMRDAQIGLRKLGIIGKSKDRDRRPTLAELDLLMGHFIDRQKRRPSAAPMTRLIAFAIFSTRRQEEIVTIKWSDLDDEHSRVLVRGMKNPGEKVGNDVWCDLPGPALEIIKAMPRVSDRIFPYTTDAVSAAFTRACSFLQINPEEMPDAQRLHFHDLRHDGVSRLFELGMNIPHAAAVSGHRSWSSLKRYTHIRQKGDKYADWKWLPAVTTPLLLPRKRQPDPDVGEP